MVKLVVDDFDQITILEDMLEKADIAYELELANKRYGLRPPFLIVKGVPLDMAGAITWIKEHDAR